MEDREKAARLAARRTGLAGCPGFTFVELVVVSALVLILASAILPLAKVTIQRNREVELHRSLREIRLAIDKWKDAADTGRIAATDLKAGSEGYPPTLEILVEGVTVANDASGRRMKFLRRIPIDPMTKSTDWGLRSYQDDPDATSWGGQGVYDVYTKSGGTGLDGTKYKGLVNRMQGLVRYRRARSEGGFTLIELMVVLVLIMVLAAMGVAEYHNAVLRTKEAVLAEDLWRMRDAIDQYYADKAKYPANLDALVGEGYLRGVPKDPITNSAESWQTVLSEPDPSNPVADIGIVDVKSGAEGTSLDGRPYSEF